MATTRATVRWLVEGPPATGWQQLRPSTDRQPRAALRGARGLPEQAALLSSRRAQAPGLVIAGVPDGGGHLRRPRSVGLGGWHARALEPPRDRERPWRGGEAVLLPGAEALSHMVQFLEGWSCRWRLYASAGDGIGSARRPTPHRRGPQPGRGPRHTPTHQRSGPCRSGGELLPPTFAASWIDAANGRTEAAW